MAGRNPSHWNDVSKRQKEDLKQIVREMCLTQFAHPQDPSILSTFLPPGAGVGTLVQVAVEQYVIYFRRVKAEAIAAVQAPVKTQLTTAQAIAQAAVQRSQAMRGAGEQGQQPQQQEQVVPPATQAQQ
jgi:hypothetical protein